MVQLRTKSLPSLNLSGFPEMVSKFYGAVTVLTCQLCCDSEFSLETWQILNACPAGTESVGLGEYRRKKRKGDEQIGTSNKINPSGKAGTKDFANYITKEDVVFSPLNLSLEFFVLCSSRSHGRKQRKAALHRLLKPDNPRRWVLGEEMERVLLHELKRN
ncbi:hypothetical protein KIN20_003958 [Parelaphostrongylus tenuis]|uniref:Uncharacterized protein n=1 Tax=Parelaphostrongylus tenuis TaxID=148309 RepID=A0AAD5MQM8_PARTN|nr:hypothetical protein KIN20_003958 [Parelaphostrongylus tenuis]